MGKIVLKNQPCPICPSSDAVQVYEDGGAKCYSCNHSFKKWGKDELGNVVDNFERVEPNIRKLRKPSIEEISELTSQSLRDRNISKKITEFYKVKVSYNADGEVDAHYYPYSETSYQVRKLPKTFYWINREASHNQLFGQERFNGGGKRLIITEGVIDALSVAEASYNRYKKFYPVVAMTASTENKQLIENRSWIRSFDEVVLILDNDAAGEKATKEATKIIGADKIRIAKMERKDPNEVLIKDGSTKLMEVVFDAARYTPAGFKTKEDLWDALVELSKVKSILYPECISGLNDKLKGRRYGEIALFVSGTGCFAKNTEILMYNGSIKKVQDVSVNDLVMGDDNTCRKVKTLFRGREEMRRVILKDGTSFECNKSHIMSLVNNAETGRWGLTTGQVMDIGLETYEKWSLKRKHLTKAIKSARLEFHNKTPLPIDPYILGTLLGASSESYYHDDNVAIVNRLNEKGHVWEKNVSLVYNSKDKLLNNLQLTNKHIPETYLTSNIECRLQLLAGLIDTNGYYCSKTKGFKFLQKELGLLLQVKRLSESLGFSTKFSKQVNKKVGNRYKLLINGDSLEDIPVVLSYKKAETGLQKRDSHKYSFTIEALPEAEYYGFEVDGNGRFVLGNFVITHNSGKSTIMREIVLDALLLQKEKVGIISLEESPEETARKLAGMYLNKNTSDEEIPLETLRKGFDALFSEENILLLDHQGSLGEESLLEQLEYMCLVGCKTIIIDHITILVSEGAEHLTGNEAQDKIMNDLLRLVKRYPVWIGLVSHLRKTIAGKKAFEEGVIPSLDDIKGSGSIKQIAFDVIGFARNMVADEIDVRNTIKMRVLKSRYTGMTGNVDASYYDEKTGRLSRRYNSDDFELEL